MIRDKIKEIGENVDKFEIDFYNKSSFIFLYKGKKELIRILTTKYSGFCCFDTDISIIKNEYKDFSWSNKIFKIDLSKEERIYLFERFLPLVNKVLSKQCKDLEKQNNLLNSINFTEKK